MTTLADIVDRVLPEMGFTASKARRWEIATAIEDAVLEAQRGYRITLTDRNYLLRPFEAVPKPSKLIETPIYDTVMRDLDPIRWLND